jgi:hypothetical protein
MKTPFRGANRTENEPNRPRELRLRFASKSYMFLREGRRLSTMNESSSVKQVSVRI